MNSQEPEIDIFKKPRPAVRLDALEKSLAAYMAAAAAAGVSLLALAPFAEAKIVYTQAHELISRSTPLDLNHDGTVDFSFLQRSSGSWTAGGVRLAVSAKSPANRIWGRGSVSGYQGKGVFADALRPGFRVGSNKSHLQRSNGLMAVFFAGNYISDTLGQWLYTKNRYLGLKFTIGGQVHYGWARLTVSMNSPFKVDATLTGYAYETIPNKPIITGKTKGPDVITLEPGSLGALAAGAPRLHK
jgi:hypothetical protein